MTDDERAASAREILDTKLRDERMSVDQLVEENRRIEQAAIDLEFDRQRIFVNVMMVVAVVASAVAAFLLYLVHG